MRRRQDNRMRIVPKLVPIAAQTFARPGISGATLGD